MSFYYYHPKAFVQLGYAIDNRNPYDDKASNGYFEWTNQRLDDPFGASLEFTVIEISNRKSLFEKMSLDINIEVKYALFNASSSLSWEKESQYDEKTITYIITARRIYNWQTLLGSVQLSNIGKQQWKKAISGRRKKILQFQRASGTEIVTRIRRGNIISLIYQFNCTTKSLKEKIQASLKAGWSSGSGSIDFKKELNSIDENLSIRIEGFQSGVSKGDVIHPKLTDIIKATPGDLNQIKIIVSDILSDVSIENRDSSPIIEYNTKLVSDVDDIALSDFYDEFKGTVELNDLINYNATKLYNLYLSDSKELIFLNKLDAKWNLADFQPNSRKLITDKIAEYETHALEIFKGFRKINAAKNEAECSITINPIDTLDLSKVLQNPVIMPISWLHYTGATKTSDEHGTFYTYFWPTVHIKFAELISFLYILRNGQRIKLVESDSIYALVKAGGDFRSIWYSDQSHANKYARGWDPTIVAQRKIEFEIIHFEKESQYQYQIEIHLVDGKVQVIDLGNANGPIPIPASYFDNMPKKEFDELKASTQQKAKINKSPIVIIGDRSTSPKPKIKNSKSLHRKKRF